MFKDQIKLIVIVCSVFYFQNVLAQNPIFEVDASYLTKHDIVYKTPAYEGFEGFPIGNGDLGGMVWNTKNGIEIQINKNDLFDQPNAESEATLRGGARLSVDLGVPAFEWLYLDDFDGRLSLRNANVSIGSKTPFSENEITSWVAVNKNVWIVNIKSKSKKGEDNSKIRVALERWGSRTFAGWYGGYSKNTNIGLGNTQTKVKGRDIILEETFKGLQFTVACRILGAIANPNTISDNRVELTTNSKNSHNLTVMVSLVTSNESKHPTSSAIALLDTVEQQSISKEKEEHQQWWDDFWNRSFVHLGNDYIENLYYFRRYLMASASRGKYPVVFNGGLWTWNHDVRNWVTPHHWNTQQQYWGLAAQNDTELMLPYINTYFSLMPQAEDHAKMRGADDAILWSEAHDFFGKMTFWNRGDMLNNFTPATQIAGFFWEYYQFTQDKQFLRDKGYPFLKKAAEFYVKKLQWDADKKEYFIYPSQPYESPRTHDLKNPITDRNMIISTMDACIKAAKTLHVDNNKIKQWQHIIDHIWPIPFREEPGLGEIMQLAYNPDGTIYPTPEVYGKWTNHFSGNTSLVFPANIIGLEDKGSREFNAASNVVKHHAPEVNAISPDAIVAARLGLGNVVMDRMRNGVRRLQHFPQGLFYNIDHWYNLSIYMDSVAKPDITTQRDYIYDARAKYPKGHPAKPFIQTGLETLSHYSAAVNEMLLQSNEGKIRVFPAIPDGWAPAFKLRARGAFLVASEKKENGQISGIWIKSLKGNDCKVVNPWEGSKVEVYADNHLRTKMKHQEKDGIIHFKTQPDSAYLIILKGSEWNKKRIFKSDKNNAPKHFLEATLGKSKNF
ncbi:glycosyl hydrolase family 95 catalytic domain-containing protein [Aestuariivivens marinum]|uniref:glycosyl hydrolase family 95 catalytic domain-containing protein n=1 Tax=Aestuariivivens marinum TaxID=2913555 RepID=UPI001F56CE8E|nr:DUF5703 domain-containing protein [Aestuariivivens marinum]